MSGQPPYPPAGGPQPWPPQPPPNDYAPPKSGNGVGVAFGGLALGLALIVVGPMLGVLVQSGVQRTFGYDAPTPVEVVAGLGGMVFFLSPLWVPLLMICFRRTRWWGIWMLVALPIALVVLAGACIVLIASLSGGMG